MNEARVSALRASTFRIATEATESDGTHTWDSTTLVIAEVEGGGSTGLGYSYADASCAAVIRDRFAALLSGVPVMDIEAGWLAMVADLRNVGRPGIGAHAVSAVDNALWDLKARLLDLPLVSLLGQVRDTVPSYASGGFTSMSGDALAEQLGAWAADGFSMVKMKVGREPPEDPSRLATARDAIGDSCALMVDANGALTRFEAIEAAFSYADYGVSYFEEPVSSDDLEGLQHVRQRAPAGMAIAAGEYGYDPWYFHAMLRASAVDILQADATRCLGITGFLKVAALCEAAHVPLSSHCAPSIHLHAAAAAAPLIHLEWFHDHVRIESLLFDGFTAPRDGSLRPPLDRPGHGLTFRARDAERWRIA